MPENASRAAVLYDQFEDADRVADWGGDDLFTRMPRPRAVDDAPPPRFRPSLVQGGRTPGEPAPAEFPSSRVGPDEPAPAEFPPSRVGPDEPAPAGSSSREPEPRRSLALVGAAGDRLDPSPPGRRTKVITGHPNGAPRPLPTVRSDRRRPARTLAEWIGPQPERMVAWTFALGLLLILIAITTA